MKLLSSLKDIAIKELQNETLSETEIEFIEKFEDEFSSLTKNIDPKGLDTRLIADIHTDPNKDPSDGVYGKCLEIGSGYVNYIIVVVNNSEGKIKAMVGPTFTYYEFRQQIGNRLSDEEWQEILEKGTDVPDKFNWMDFPDVLGSIVKEVSTDLAVSTTDITFSEHNITRGDKVEITVEVHNKGKYNATGIASIYLNNKTENNLIRQKPLNVFKGSSENISVTFDTTNADIGSHDVIVMLDRIEPIDICRSNNIAKRSILISSKDNDGDGYPDINDSFPYDPNEWNDTDSDGYGDNIDVFPEDPSEWKDSDGDGYGDNCDAFPFNALKWEDKDTDNNSNNSDVIPRCPYEWIDTDGDGYCDHLDIFPFDPSEWGDLDGDGYGDNTDAFPTDINEWSDSDGDGYGDNTDYYPNDPSRHIYEPEPEPVNEMEPVIDNVDESLLTEPLVKEEPGMEDEQIPAKDVSSEKEENTGLGKFQIPILTISIFILVNSLLFISILIKLRRSENSKKS
jgi:hypothetical protein